MDEMNINKEELAEEICEENCGEELAAEEIVEEPILPAPHPADISHLRDSFPRGAVSPRSGISKRELAEAREIFSGLSDREIHRLYRKVTQ